MKVVLSGIYYPVAIVRYFQSALLRRDDVELYTVGPYTGNSIPWANGMFVDCPLPKPDLVIGMESNHNVDVNMFERLLPWVPDVWVQVDAAYHLRGRPSKAKHVVVGTDPHCVGYDYVRATADTFYCMQTPYLKANDRWLPYAYDPAFHSPLDVEKTYDFGIVGADGRQGPLYENRNKLVQALRDRGYNVLQVFGKAYNDYRQLLSQCKVGLNWSTRLDTTARVFETMGMGVALLTNTTPDLGKLEFEPGTDYEGFDDLNGALLRAELLMSDDHRMSGKRWENVAATGSTTVRKHTWDARVETILNNV